MRPQIILFDAALHRSVLFLSVLCSLKTTCSTRWKFESSTTTQWENGLLLRHTLSPWNTTRSPEQIYYRRKRSENFGDHPEYHLSLSRHRQPTLFLKSYLSNFQQLDLKMRSLNYLPGEPLVMFEPILGLSRMLCRLMGIWVGHARFFSDEIESHNLIGPKIHQWDFASPLLSYRSNNH